MTINYYVVAACSELAVTMQMHVELNERKSSCAEKEKPISPFRTTVRMKGSPWKVAQSQPVVSPALIMELNSG